MFFTVLFKLLRLLAKIPQLLKLYKILLQHEIIFQDWDLAYKLINSANRSDKFWKFIIIFFDIILVFDALFRLFLWLHH